MKLIIDIPEVVKHKVYAYGLSLSPSDKEQLIKAIMNGTPLDKLRAEILEEKECAYADFDKYKVDYLGVDSRYVEDELPYNDFRYGMERCIEIIDNYREDGE